MHQITVSVPPEFAQLAESRGLTPAQVLAAFMADLAHTADTNGSDERTAEIKRIWTDKTLRQQGLAGRVVHELERRAVLAGYSQIYLTTGFRQPEAVRLYLSQGYQPQFDLNRDPEEYSQPPFDGRLRFTKTLVREAFSKTA